MARKKDEDEAPDESQAPPPPDEGSVLDTLFSAAKGRKKPACPDCGKSLDVYDGDNPHKQGTGYCEHCGTRTRLTE